MADHDAHVNDWLWHLRGWRPGGRLHEARAALTAAEMGGAGDGAATVAIKAALMRPVSPAKRDLAERRVARLTELQMGGPPVIPAPTGGRGRPSTRCQYDRAVDQVLAESANQHRASLPAMGRASGYLADPAYMAILTRAMRDQALTSKTQIAARVIEDLRKAGAPEKRIPDARSILRHLAGVSR